MLEIERDYLVKRLPSNFKKYPHEKIKQGYLSFAPAGLRVRKIGKKYELTKKYPQGKGFSTHEEINILLKPIEFRKIWPLTGIFNLDKTRYFVPLAGGLTAEVDVFTGKLSGLIIAEVEFGSKKQMKKFTPPDWFGRDVTEQKQSANIYLAGHTYPQVKKYFQ